jgi:uncharacterized protein
MRARALGLLASVVLVSSPVLAQEGYPTWQGDAVQDDAGILSTTQEDSLRTLLAPPRSRGVDVRVLTIVSMSDYPALPPDVEGFAHGVFDRWRVGDRPERDGVLLLVATADRKLRIQLGDGVLHLQADAQQVVDDSILPYFREGMRPRGILRGTAGIAEWFTPEGAASRPPAPAAAQPAYTPRPAYAPPRLPGGGGLVLIVVGGLIAGVPAYERHRRNRPRDCGQCGTRMTRLDEVGDDVYLDSGQKAEELLRSVDYDVWKCGACGSHTLIPYAAWFTSATTCPSCRYRTVLTTTNVVQQATYDFGGQKEIIRNCRSCGFHDRDVIYLPQLTRPTQNDLGSSTSFASSDLGSSGSSSSGGDFSSGGGASGSW